MKLFISYSSNDRPQVEQLKNALVKLDHQVWFDQEGIGAGSFYAEEISKALHNNLDALLLFASQHSIGDSNNSGSNEVQTELSMAKDLGIPIIPLKVDRSLDVGGSHGFKYLLKNRQWLDIEAYLFSHNYDQIAAMVDKQLFKTHEYIDNSVFSDQLVSAEQLIKDKQFAQAIKFIDKLTLPPAFESERKILKLISILQAKTIKNLPKQHVDSYVQILNSINDEMFVPACFLKALLSECYYKKCGYADMTEGFMVLKHTAQPHGRLKAKYILMTDGVAPEQALLARNWRL